MPILRFTVPGEVDVWPTVERVLLGGYTGRREQDVAVHVAEMQKLGVTSPSSLPVFYEALPCLLTQGKSVYVVGEDTLPEVEFVLFGFEGRQYVTVGNDQFDLAIEKHSPAKSKGLCQKVVATAAWALDEITDHWDHLHLELCSRGTILQASSVDCILKPAQLLDKARWDCRFDAQAGMLFSGTVPNLSAIDACTRDFTIKLQDRFLDREIRCDFDVVDVTSR
ncbi:DUF2848 family protein [Aminobacter anthyllidis]|uniref:DUF2848 family protein n=1 Tax=Aminobacter anthyllidis TaxID=1035067 RepID=A0A9X1ACB1_9HYPH|nr:DUF2848 family protein [Aminobacter anthyllidis]MBT1157205.1 DUF2848 family protein [Aminobacter anthyllidis]